MRALVVVLVFVVGCASQARTLAVADSCACSPKEFCLVRESTAICKPLPRTCAMPSCACVGSKEDSCRDEDGRITLMPRRTVTACDACSSDEYCLDGNTCGVLPPQCDEEKTCDCFSRVRDPAKKLSCATNSGRIVLTSR